MTVPAAAAGTWRLGAADVNRLGLGTMRLTVDPDRDRAVRLVREAVELGVDHLDTAAFYVSPGGILDGEPGPVRHAIEIVREALTPWPDHVVVATKVGPGRTVEGRWSQATTAPELRAQVEENLRRLGRDHLDLVNLRIVRRPGEDSVVERFGALAEMREAGMIENLGLSNVRLDHLHEASAIAPVTCVQNAYAIDDRRSDDVLHACREHGIAFVPFFAIAGGGRESGASGEHAEALRGVAARHGVTEHQVRLAWTLHQGDHVLAIPGTGNPAHLRANVAAASLRLDHDDLAALG